MCVDDHQEECIVPDIWISNKSVLWPPVVDAESAIKNRRKPAKSWSSFKLVKEKFSSGITNDLYL